jgi:hypothetical protein
LAIDELCFGLTGANGRAGTVEVRFVLRDETLEVEGQGHFGQAQAQPVLSDLSKVILDALVDEHALVPGEGGPRFRLVKRRDPVG